MRLDVMNGRFAYKNSETLFSNVSFSLESGEILTILGPNGAGKTTLLKCITGLLLWGKGSTFFGEEALSSMKPADVWKKVGYVPQARSLVFSYTALEMVIMGRAPHLGLLSLPSKKDKEIALSALEMVEMPHLADRSCSEISGGELQLVLIARALASEPELLVLDEPETHLDFKKQLLILNILEKLAKNEGISCLVNTHYPNHALRIANKTLILGGDSGYAFGNTEDVITEDSLEKYFGVRVKMMLFNGGDREIKILCPIDIAEEDPGKKDSDRILVKKVS